jgi:hypothetical protein
MCRSGNSSTRPQLVSRFWGVNVIFNDVLYSFIKVWFDAFTYDALRGRNVVISIFINFHQLTSNKLAFILKANVMRPVTKQENFQPKFFPQFLSPFSISDRLTRDRCYDFLKYFRRKIWRKNWRFWRKTKLNFEHWYLRKMPIISPKIGTNRRKLWSQHRPLISDRISGVTLLTWWFLSASIRQTCATVILSSTWNRFDESVSFVIYR